MPTKIDPKKPTAKQPTGARGLKLIERYEEIGEFGEPQFAALPRAPRYLVTYMNSQTGGRLRSATVISITNQSTASNTVSVSFFK